MRTNIILFFDYLLIISLWVLDQLSRWLWGNGLDTDTQGEWNIKCMEVRTKCHLKICYCLWCFPSILPGTYSFHFSFRWHMICFGGASSSPVLQISNYICSVNTETNSEDLNVMLIHSLKPGISRTYSLDQNCIWEHQWCSWNIWSTETQ